MALVKTKFERCYGILQICGTIECTHVEANYRLNPKNIWYFLNFGQGLHFLSLHPIFLIFLGLFLLFEIYLSMKYFIPNYL